MSPADAVKSRLSGGSSAGVVVLTVSLGIAAAVAVLGFGEAVLSGPLGCPAPLSCGAAAAVDHLPPPTVDRQLPQAAIASGLGTLARISVALTAVLIGLAGLNVATIALTRTSAGRGDDALRAALGATPFQLLASRATVATRVAAPSLGLGIALGLLGAWWLRVSWPEPTPPWPAGPALGTGAVLSAVLLLAILFLSLCWPATLGSKQDLRSRLGGGAQSSPGPIDTLVKDSLAAAQAGASLVLLVTAGLLVVGFSAATGRKTEGEDPGIRTMLLEISTPAGGAGVQQGSPRAARYAGLLERVRGVPGVMDSSLASEGAWLGLGVTEQITSFCLDCSLGLLPKVQTSAPARVHVVGPDFFQVVGVPLLRGRELRWGDDATAERVAVISEAMALRYFPNGDPLDKEVRLGGLNEPWFRVVGVVDDLEPEGLGTGSLPEPALYLSIFQAPPASATLLARTSAAAPAPGAEIGRVLSSALPGIRTEDRGTLADARARYRAPLRWFGWLFAVLAAASLVCACTGMYALISAQVRLQRREIGIRMAIGAEARRIVRMITARTLRRVTLGAVVGLIPLGGIARLLQLRFEGVDPWDPALAVAVGALLVGVALAASYRPARRAAAVDPVVAMRGIGVGGASTFQRRPNDG